MMCLRKDQREMSVNKTGIRERKFISFVPPDDVMMMGTERTISSTFAAGEMKPKSSSFFARRKDGDLEND